MSQTAEPKKKSNTALYVIVGLVVIGAVIGMIYFFSKSSQDKEEKTSTTTTNTSSGLAGLLGGLNLSGLSLVV